MDLEALKANYTPIDLGGPKPQKKRGGVVGFASRLAGDILSPAAYLGKTVFVNPTREIAAQVTGNTQAMKNAKRMTNLNLGLGENGDQIGNALKRWGGNSAQAALNLVVPEAGSIGKQAALGAGFGASQAVAQDNSSAQNVLEGAVGGGLTGGVVGGASKLLGKVAGRTSKAVESQAGKVAEKKASQEAYKSVEPYVGLSTKETGNRDIAGLVDLFKNKFKMGTSPKELRAASKLATGEQSDVSGIISGHMRGLLQDVGHVPTEGIVDKARQALIKEAGILGNVEEKSTAANGVLRSVRNFIQGTALKGEGSIGKGGRAGANALFDTLQQIEGRMRELGTAGADAAEKRVLKATKNAIEDNLYGHEGLNKAISKFKFAPDDAATTRQIILENGGTKELADHIVEGINNAKTGKDIRALQRPFVEANKLADAADKYASGTGFVKQAAKGAKEGVNGSSDRSNFYKALEIGRLAKGDPTAALPLLASAKNAKGGQIVERAEGLVGRVKRANNVLPDKTSDLLARTATQTGAIEQAKPQQDEETTQPTTDFATSEPDTETGETPESGSVYTQDSLLADIKRDPKNMSDYITLYKLFNPKPSASATSAQKKATVAAKNARATLDQISSSFAQTGGGKGVVGGLLSNVAGRAGINSSVATYNDTATALAASLYKALGNTGTISDKDQELIAKLIPKTTDTDTTARAKIAQLESLLQQAEENALSLGVEE